MAKEQKETDHDPEKYTIKLTVNEENKKLFVAVKSNETKHVYGASLSPSDLSNGGFPSNLSQNLRVVSEYIQSIINGKQQQCKLTIEESGQPDDGGAEHVILRITQSVIIDIMLIIPLKDRPKTDIISDHIIDLKAEILELKQRLIASELEQQRLKQHVMPQGTVVMWTGTVEDIPSGWKLCDGTNGTPDLRNKFAVNVYSIKKIV